jgi:TonB family protein
MKPILTAGVLALGIHGLLFSLDFNWTAKSSFKITPPLVLNMTLTRATGKLTSKPDFEKNGSVSKKQSIDKKEKEPVRKKKIIAKKYKKHIKHRHLRNAPPTKPAPIPVKPQTHNTSKAIADQKDKTDTFDFEHQESGSKIVSKRVEQNGASFSPIATTHEARPAYRSNPSPIYPRIARIRGYQGNVLLDVFVNDHGTVDEIKVFRSSGYPVLDRAAKSTVKQWQFEPGRIGEKKVGMWVRVPIRFELME